MAFARGGAQAKVEPAPGQETSDEKSPLTISIQLMKRHRDIMFQDRDDGPISIIITTLAAHAYQQERSLVDTLRKVLERMPAFIDRSLGYPNIPNPTIGTENFADKWQKHPERERAFYEWNRRAKADLDRLSTAKGMSQLRAAFVPFLGEKRADIVLNRMAEKTKSKRSDGLKVDMSTGLVGVASGIVVPKANFYGNA